MTTRNVPLNFNIKTFCSHYVRMSYAILVFSLSLLAIFKAPTRLLWIIAILVTECGHILAMSSLLVLLPGWRSSRLGRLSVMLGLSASLLALTPLIRAASVKKRLPEQFEVAFGKHSENDSFPNRWRQSPLDYLDVFRGIDYPTIACTTFVYRIIGEDSLTLDLYRPAPVNSASPGVVVIHGGAWQSGNSKQLPELNSYLASRGYLVAALNYRLAPSWRYPAPVEDIQAAVSYLNQHATQFGLDPTRLVLLGRSAGGHLALQVAYASNESAIRGVISFYGPADLYYGYTHPANPLVIDSRKVLVEFLGGSPDELPEIYRRASPIHYVGASTPPTLLIHGGRDELVSPAQSRRLADRLRDRGVAHVYLELPWATHGCDFNLNGASGQLIVYAVERFLAAVSW